VPAIKAWNNLVAHFTFNHGYSRERSIEFLKVLPEGKAAIERVIEAAAVAVTKQA
jgi:hypothetical protein